GGCCRACPNPLSSAPGIRLKTGSMTAIVSAHQAPNDAIQYETVPKLRDPSHFPLPFPEFRRTQEPISSTKSQPRVPTSHWMLVPIPGPFLHIQQRSLAKFSAPLRLFYGERPAKSPPCSTQNIRYIRSKLQASASSRRKTKMPCHPWATYIAKISPCYPQQVVFVPA